MLAVVEGMLAAAEASLGRLDEAIARVAAVREQGILQQRPVLAACLSLQEGFIDLARGDSDAARARIDALHSTDGSLSPALETTEVRGMLRLLEEAIG